MRTRTKEAHGCAKRFDRIDLRRLSSVKMQQSSCMYVRMYAYMYVCMCVCMYIQHFNIVLGDAGGCEAQ